MAGGPIAACKVCGAAPAAPVTVRGHQGMLVIMRFLRQQGTFCQTCALAIFRNMQADTLIQGWWGALSVFITPVTLLRNLGALSSIRSMPAPVMPGTRPPLDPGKPVFKRPEGILALVPLGLVALAAVAVPVLFVIGLISGPSGDGDGRPVLRVGSCAHNNATWPEQDLRSVSCGSSQAQFRVLDPEDPDCESLDLVAYPEYSSSGDVSLCLKELKK
ncbi:hypothetical protein ACF1BE_28775 [Streptomyces sp. NPDC014991]|uniref:LppU/SCO3897 family protein n=1 Tax=Streptomyces sp. NPDC014991 TaxID=3364935 RepID=UPI0036F8D06C